MDCGFASQDGIDSPTHGQPNILLAVFPILRGLWIQLSQPLFDRNRQTGPIVLLRGVLGTTGFLLLFGALRRIPLADTVIIFQAHPLFVAALSPWILKERLRTGQWICIIASLFGVALIIGPTGEGTWLGRIMALVCAALSGVTINLVRHLRNQQIGPLTIALSFPLVATITIGPALALSLPHCVWTPPTLRDWGFLGALASAATMAQVMLTVGLGRVAAAQGAAMSNLQVIFAIGFGLVFLGEIPALTTLAGAAIIITSLLIFSLGFLPSTLANSNK